MTFDLSTISSNIEALTPYMTESEITEIGDLLELYALEQDWSLWAKTMFPQYTPGDFAPFHAFTWEWFWRLRLGVRQEGLLKIVSRFFAKSTTVQLALTAAGARKTRKYVLYVSGTQAQANDHVQTMGSLLENTKLSDFYPDMGTRRVGKHGNSQGWRRNRFWTQEGFIVDAIGLDKAVRGIKLEEMRPDLMIFDDIDGKHDSPQMTQRKIDIITKAIMPAGDPNSCTYVFAQNLIIKDGVFGQIYDGRLKILKNRSFFGIVPAVRNLKWEYDEDGFGVITAGETNWEWMSIEKLQKAIDDFDIDTFLQECQHDVDRALPGALFGEFSEPYCVITDSEFADGWAEATGEHLQRGADGRIKMPDCFTIGRYLDIGTTKEHPTAVSWWSSVPEFMPLSDCVFSHREMLFPKDWWSAGDAFEPFSPGSVAESVYRAEMKANERGKIKDTDCYMSHEASMSNLAFDMDVPEPYKLRFQKWRGDFKRMEGVGIMQNFMRINPHKKHPFRKYPPGHEKAGLPLEGSPRFFLIVADGQGELYTDEFGEMRVKQATNASGQRRARWEIPKYRLHSSAHGEEADAPKRINDDWISTAKAAAVYGFPKRKRQTTHQRAVQKAEEMAPHLTPEAIGLLPDKDRSAAHFRRNQLIAEVETAVSSRSKPASRLARFIEERERRS